MFPGALGHALAGKALAGLPADPQAGPDTRADPAWSLDVRDIRVHAPLPHRRVDDRPYGGGAGMVLRPDVVDAALTAVPRDDRPLLFLTPRGRVFAQRDAEILAAGSGVVLLCGRYEGIDQRVIEAHAADEVSIGDFVLSGGELAAMVLLDACVRLLPGVMGDAQSGMEESFSGGLSGGPAGRLLEYPHYTRPERWGGVAVPPVLLSGNHAAVAAWRRAEAQRITRARRPDLCADGNMQRNPPGRPGATTP